MLFISYSRADVTGTKNLSNALSGTGVDFWLDESSIPVGQAFVAQLGEALQRSDAFLLIDTPASRCSYWVSREVTTAIRYRAEGRYHTLFRIYAPGCEDGVGSPWDASVPLDTDAHDRIAEFLAARPTPTRAVAPSGDVSGVSIASNGLGQPSNWSGRQGELRYLDEWWLGPGRGAWVQGLGGIGKSGLVQTWITALAYLGYEDPVRASVLHVSGREVVETGGAIGRLATWQRDGHEGKLFFLDGYDEAPRGTDLEVLLQEALRLGSRVVVTSRSEPPSALLRSFRNISLDSMSRRDATSVLAEFGIGGPEGVAAASALGDHPLALMLFARYVTSGKRTAAEALEDLRGAALMNLNSTGPAKLGSTLQATVAASVRALTSDAKRLLRALCAAPDPGVVSLAEFRSQWEPARPDTLRELARASLIQVDQLDMPTTIAIHPLVRNFVKESPGGAFAETDSVA